MGAAGYNTPGMLKPMKMLAWSLAGGALSGLTALISFSAALALQDRRARHTDQIGTNR